MPNYLDTCTTEAAGVSAVVCTKYRLSDAAPTKPTVPPSLGSFYFGSCFCFFSFLQTIQTNPMQKPKKIMPKIIVPIKPELSAGGFSADVTAYVL